jgi:hypothetical protein
MTYPTQREQAINQVPLSIEFSSDPRENQETLSLMYKRLAQAINTKTGGLFSLAEQVNAEQYSIKQPTNATQVFDNVYRKTFDMVALNGGAIAAGATITFPHLILGITSTAHIYGSATNSDTPIKYLPLPYVSATLITDQVQIYLTPTNVVLINGSTQSILTSATIVAEYLKT